MKEIVPGRVSVIIAAYNAASTIRETLNSVLAQTHRDLEVIICDDASTDSTADIIESYSNAQITLLKNQKNLGPGPSRNKAIENASGEWIALVDADDVLHPDRTELLLKAAAGDTNVIVFDNHWECHHTPQGMVPWRTVRSKQEFGLKEGEAADIDIAHWLTRPRLLMHPMLPTKAIRDNQIHYSNRRFVEDTEFYLSVLAKGLRLRYLASALYLYRVTPHSLSSNNQRWKGVSEIYRNAATNFNHEPSVKKSLLFNAKKADKNYRYHEWLRNMRRGELSSAISMTIKEPTLVTTCLKKIVLDTFDHISRTRHSGQGRG